MEGMPIRPAMSISVCIATYRRLDRLEQLLNDLRGQDLLPDEVTVVDNDPLGSARAVVDRFMLSQPPFAVLFDVQPVKNISLTRNRTVELARCDWLAFLDDDERVPRTWLGTLMEAAVRYQADGVLGPVEPLVPKDAPAWIRRGRFYDFPRMSTGSVIPPNRLRFGNLVLRGATLKGMDVIFDPAYGLTGGEDGDLLSRMVLRGARIVWCDEAIVHEPIETSRLTLKWLLRRSMRGGQDFARHFLSGRYGARPGGRAILFGRALLQLLLAAVLSVASLPFGRHHAAHWMMKMTANLGKLSVFLGLHYREYA